MKERPIIFSAPMVQAILRREKTQTRRVISTRHVPLSPWGFMPNETDTGWPEVVDECGDSHPAVCPYGVAGERLWVRETWQAWTEHDNTSPNDLPEEARQRINYTANGNVWDAKLRPSIHMPRWASRITLEVTGVRVERLQDISEDDARAEGVRPADNSVTRHDHEYRDLFRALWEQINGEGSWAANPWVWRVSFRRVEP